MVVRGFSGYNTRQCIHVLPKVLDESLAKEIVALTIFLGANDSNDAELNPSQNVPIEEYKDNLKKLVEICMVGETFKISLHEVCMASLDLQTGMKLCFLIWYTLCSIILNK